MAEMTEKLYPPVISGTLPAFYTDGTVTKITVPFSMSRAVNSSQIGGFSLKIKTVQSNTLLTVLSATDECTSQEEVDNLINSAIQDRKVSFILSDTSKIKIGQFLKIQLAYKSLNGTIGYYSTVGIIKYTSKPKVYIEGFNLEPEKIRAFQSSYTGIYEPTQDKSERPYSYKFSLYNKEYQLIETSGWLLHNTSINNIASESLSLDRTTDTYSFKTEIVSDEEYSIQYTVRTINNMEISSPLYSCIEPHIGPSSFEALLKAENIFEEGYIQISFDLREEYFFNITVEELEKKYKNNCASIYKTRYSGTNKTAKIYFKDEKGENISIIQLYYNKPGDEGTTIVKYEIQNPDTQKVEKTFYQIEDSPVSIEICRSEKTNNFKSWKVMQKVYLSSYDYAINRWNFKDFAIEQGVTYKYCFRQYGANNILSERSLSNPVTADFEDMFLWDGKKQVKVRFNPQVSSFKINRLEQKMDTIGSRYPFIFRNGQVEYKEFPISGLISYLADNNELFINHQEDLNIILGSQIKRSFTPVNQDFDDTIIGKSWETSETLDSVGYNMRAERRFKLKLLDWLGNGEIKMFKSPAEGNYLVRLLNISLSPENKLSRMLHTFSCTAYEVEEYSYQNLIELGFLTPNEKTDTNIGTKTILLKDLLLNQQNFINTTTLKVNSHPIFEYLRIDKSKNSNNNRIYLRLGSDQNAKREMTESVFTIEIGNQELPDVYLNINDYEEFFISENTLTFNEKINILIDQIGDTEITFEYYSTTLEIASLYNIKDVYLINEVETFIGPKAITFNPVSQIIEPSTGTTEETIKFYSLNFKPKTIRKLIQVIESDTEKYKDPIDNTFVTKFDRLSYYQIFDNDGNKIKDMCLNENEVLHELTQNEIEAKNRVILTTLDGALTNEIYDLQINPPLVDLNQYFYTRIEIGYGVYLDCAYQNKIVKYNNTF